MPLKPLHLPELVNAVNPDKYRLFDGFAHLASGLACGLAGLAAGMAIGIVGDAGVRYAGSIIMQQASFLQCEDAITILLRTSL